MCTAGFSTPEAPQVRLHFQLPEFGKRNEKQLSAPPARGCGKGKCHTGAGEGKIDGISETVTKRACKHGFPAIPPSLRRQQSPEKLGFWVAPSRLCSEPRNF